MSQLLCGHEMQTHSNSLANLVHGVGERVLFVNSALERPIKPKDRIFEKLSVYRELIARDIGRQSPVTREEFAGFYKGPRHATYLRAVDGLAHAPVRGRDAHLKTFVKAEKHNFSLKPNVVPRVIQPRDPRYNVEVGRYLRPIEKQLYHSIDKLYDSPTIMSEYNSYTQARLIREKWEKFSHPVCVGLDASRFDQHVSAQALRFEHSLYNDIFKSKELKLLLTWQIRNIGKARASDGWFNYEKYGSRMSGDMNTSMGNKLLMCLMSKAYIDSLPFEVAFVNNGDDCLMILDRNNIKSLNQIETFYRDFGFKIVLEKPVYEFEQIEFCQTKPICANGIWRMVRNVKTCLSKDVTCVNLGHSKEEYRKWLYDIGSCGLTTASDVPVLGSFYRMLQRFGVAGKYSHSFDNEFKWYRSSSRNAKCKHTTVDDYGRYSFWLSTGMIPDVQIQLENYFNNSVWGNDKRQLVENIPYLIQYA
jgi:hypothetical protein